MSLGFGAAVVDHMSTVLSSWRLGLLLGFRDDYQRLRGRGQHQAQLSHILLYLEREKRRH
jgi:hypothetical protein